MFIAREHELVSVCVAVKFGRVCLAALKHHKEGGMHNAIVWGP